MKTTPFWNFIKLLLVLGIICSFAHTAIAQNYYPANIGNEWVLARTDGVQHLTYSLEEPEDVADKELILLKIETKNPNRNNIIDTDKYFLTTDEEGIKIHKTILQQTIGVTVVDATADFPTPVIFFPKVLTLGDRWDVAVDTTIDLLGTDISVTSTTDFEIVDFEDITTPAGTFQNCAKIELKSSITSAILNINLTSYQWLAPDVGPIKYENNDGHVFEMVSLKLVGPPPLNAQNPPVWQLPSLNYQVTGSRLGNILSAKILENVEDYVTEVSNLGIVSVTGDIVPPGDGTGFATNFQSKQDLWVAGRYANAPIRGRITLFAENNRGRTTVTIDVTINN